MQAILQVLIPVAVAGVFLVLVFGVISMLRGGSFNAKNSNRLMRMRVLAQLFAVILILVFFLIAKH